MSAKILLLDIETAPAISFTWQKYETNTVDELRDWSILCFAYKWLDGPVHVEAIDPPSSLSQFISSPRNDYKLVRSLWRLLDEADIICGHNLNSFDNKKIVSRFLYYGLPRPSPYKQIDTKVAVKRVASNTSNKLDDLGKHWGLGRKLKHQGWDMWLECMKGNRRAWSTMKSYNKQDVLLLEKVYKRVRPFMSNHPNLDNYSVPTVCPTCGSDRGFHSGGVYTNKTTKYKMLRCKVQSCRAPVRLPVNVNEKRPLIGL